jgi:hypothetical protein
MSLFCSLQGVSDRAGRTFTDGLPVRRAQCIACEAGPESGTLALVQLEQYSRLFAVAGSFIEEEKVRPPVPV